MGGSCGWVYGEGQCVRGGGGTGVKDVSGDLAGNREGRGTTVAAEQCRSNTWWAYSWFIAIHNMKWRSKLESEIFAPAHL